MQVGPTHSASNNPQQGMSRVKLWAWYVLDLEERSSNRTCWFKDRSFHSSPFSRFFIPHRGRLQVLLFQTLCRAEHAHSESESHQRFRFIGSRRRRQSMERSLNNRAKGFWSTGNTFLILGQRPAGVGLQGKSEPSEYARCWSPKLRTSTNWGHRSLPDHSE